MKKNKMLRLASALLVLTLLSTSVVGGTFAKYTTDGTGSDTARVAKWGVTFGVGTGMFAESYKDIAVTDNTATVKVSTTGTNLVAPGTKGTGLGVSNTTTTNPEVSYKVAIKLNADTAAMPSLQYTPKDETNSKTYEPVKFTVTIGSTKLKENIGLEGLKDLFADEHVFYMYDVAVGKYFIDSDGNGTVEESEKTSGLDTAPGITVTWAWEYQNTDTTTQKLNDELDTILGDTAAGSTITSYSGGAEGATSITEVKTTVQLDWIITATQID